MANEAVIIELGHDGGQPRRYQCVDNVAITKGTLCQLNDPNTVSGSTVISGAPFGGIAAMDKVASDGALDIALYTEGIFDLTTSAGAGITVGSLVVMSGANLIRTAVAADLLTGAVVGKALETASASEVIRVAVGGLV